MVLEFLEDVLLDLVDVALGVDEVVVEDFFKGLEGIPGLFFEDAVASHGEGGVVVGGAFFEDVADAGAGNFFVVFFDFEAAFELAFDRGFFLNEKHHDVDGGLAEVDPEGGAVEFAAEDLHLGDEEFEALDLDLGAGEAVEDDAIAEVGFKEFAEDESDDLAVADHVAGVFDAAGLGGIEQGADDDGFAGEAAGFEDEFGVGAFAGTGGTAEEDDFFGEAEIFAAECFFQVGPDRGEDEGGVLDFEVLVLGGDEFGLGGGGGRGLAHGKKGGGEEMLRVVGKG